MSAMPSVLEFVNLVRTVRGFDAIPAIDLRDAHRGTTDRCVLARVLVCEVAGSCEPGEFAMVLQSAEDAATVARATGQPQCANHPEVLLPREMGDLVVAFESGLVIPDPYGMGYVWAWAVPRDASGGTWDLVTPQGALVTEADAIDFMFADDETL